MTIGEVLGRLQPEFPDVTISKIRFLEAEGLIEPQRTQSGYRKFTHADLERLKYILAVQRDEYLPLRIIKEHLDAVDRGAEPPPLRRRPPRGLVATDTVYDAATLSGEQDVRLTRRQLADAAGLDADRLGELEKYGLLSRKGSHYDGAALAVACTAAALSVFGFEARHLRSVKAAADRELGMIEQAVTPMLRQRAPGAHDRAVESAREIGTLWMKLHATFVSSGLRESLDP
jgi:DNA-binding transcriptional MerR regulator